jgi:hypothetical protein
MPFAFLAAAADLRTNAQRQVGLFQDRAARQSDRALQRILQLRTFPAKTISYRLI